MYQQGHSASISTASAPAQASATQDNMTTILYDLDKALQSGNFDEVKQKSLTIRQHMFVNPNVFAQIYTTHKNCITQDNLLNSACSVQACENPEILRYLLQQTDILHNLINVNFDEDRIIQQRIETFRLAICSNEFSMVEMLYDFWCCKIHWAAYCTNYGVVAARNIMKVRQTLDKAREACNDWLNKHSDVLVNVHCLLQFNIFQNELYTELEKLKPVPKEHDTNAQVVKNLILTVLNIYKKYSSIYKVLMPGHEHEEKIIELLSDTSSRYTQIRLYIIYEVYFRKLDWNVCLLLLDNLEFLRLFANPDNDANLRQEIECVIYYFTYRTSQDWILYLPSNRTLESADVLGIYNDKLINMQIKYDKQKIIYGAVLFLERIKFVDCLERLRQVTTMKLVKEDNRNCLTLQSFENIRDDYSLKKIINVVENVLTNCLVVDEMDVLIIERAIIIIGEMLKSTPISNHLLETTKALIQAEFSFETVRYLNELRDYMTHAYKGLIITRINTASNHLDMYTSVKDDLIKMVAGLKRVLEIYTPIVNRGYLDKGLHLLEKRIIQIELCQVKGLANKQLIRERDCMLRTKENLNSGRDYFDNYVNETVLDDLLKYFKAMKKTLGHIQDNNDLWNGLKEQKPLSSRKLPECIDKLRLTQLIDRLESGATSDPSLIKDLKRVKDYSDEWKVINNVLLFCTKEVSALHSYYNQTANQGNSEPNENNVKVSCHLIEIILQRANSQLVTPHTQDTYDGIKNLAIFFKQSKQTKATKPNDLNNIKINREKNIDCLINRINVLRQQLNYSLNKPLEQHLSVYVLQYKCDPRFRSIVEMALADIFNIFSKCCMFELTKKQNNLLAGINLGNVLDHGNPYLEVTGDILDADDLPTALMSKAIMVVEHGEHIEALYELFKNDVDFTTVNSNDISKLDDELKKHLELFRKCSEWKTYVKLINIYSGRRHSISTS